ncbi:hypothetical protein DY000_02002058 [Brassica cretica]|uniref:YDG domain-containing protein n=1 Tax=Brassica cretica TaxID=69181 RepID=A0ABQ7C226_BRACR|nr:hypothetical protein DY000_02002058 [Brassica cretica]
MYDSNSTDSSADSSSLALVTKEAAEGCGVISLADGPPAMCSGNDQGSEAISPTLKGKEIETSGAAETSLTALWGGIRISGGGSAPGVTMGISGVPYNKASGKRALSTGDAVIHDPYVGHEDINSHTDTSKIPMGIPFEDESDDYGRDMASKGQVYVGQVFATRDAFKLHMSLGANCGWRAYAVKIGGTTRFETRTADTAHTCSVNERCTPWLSTALVSCIFNVTETFVFRDLVCSSDVGLAQGAVG